MSDRGKLGLALSGGGFRASFFHLGVLARLAEERLLRQVEVISTVSGGSIIGAAYYVRLRRLLNDSAEPADSDYERIVADLDRAFRDAVDKNFRARVLANPLKNIRMLLPAPPGGRAYSRTDRIGELCDSYLYRPLMDRGGRTAPVELRELKIEPPGAGESFNPTLENANRSAKAPILIVNATTLNTGHGWRFEAVCMGENVADPDVAADETLRDVDKNRELERGYFDPPDGEGHRQLPKPLRDFPLGLAVAASAAVPGIFQPLAITGMYEGVRVRLVDGGVHDNQGVGVLADTDCKRMIVSDASAQMPDVPKPKPWIPFVAARSLSIFSDRVREQQLTLVKPDPNPGDSAADVRLVHLRKGLSEQKVEPGNRWESDERDGATAFGVDQQLQEALARIRTDLDTFSQIEAAALGCDAYLITDHVLAPRRREFGLPPLPPQLWSSGGWSFKAAAEGLRAGDARFGKHLDVGSLRFFRALGLGTSTSVARRMPVVAATALLALAVYLVVAEDWVSASLTVWLERAILAPFVAVVVAALGSWFVLALGHVFRRSGRLPQSSAPAGR